VRLFSSESSLIISKEIESGIFHVQLNRPEKLNALSIELFESLSQTATNLKKNKAIRAVILSGNGKAFCSGLDLKSAGPGQNPENSDKLLKKPAKTEYTNLAQDSAYLWRALPFPVIACLHGVCFGGGLQIALGADFRIATPDCKLSIMEVKWGLIPDITGSITFRELIRMDVAKELAMTARVFTAEEGVGYGLVTRYIKS
jgi:enoyl-CoA hydratase/carnithine racemase